MSPNLFLVAKRATTPWTWHQFHEKKTKLHFAKDPVPGIYATTHDGKRYLVAIKPSNQNAIDAVFRNDHHEKPRTRLAPKFSSNPDLTSSSISGVENDDLSITRMGSRSLPSINLSSTTDNNANLQDSFSDDYEISDREAESFSSASTSSSERSEEILPTIAIAYSGCESGCCSEDPYLSYAEPRFSHDGINSDEDKEALLFSRRSFSSGNHLTKQYVNYASPSSGRSLRLGESSVSTELHNMQSQLTSSFNTAAYTRFDISNTTRTTSFNVGRSPCSSRNQSQVEIDTPPTTPSTTKLNRDSRPQLRRTEQQPQVPSQY
ncbi:hypothetical protein B0J14DRAFT_557893 [Halenospora varia]|nr:hypothetical protein B0J14DRAFT_557893 [Halenospora varia]